MDRDRRESFLVVGPSWVGDMVMAQSLFMSLKANHPDCQITVLAPLWTRPLLDRMPEVEGSIDSPIQHGELTLNSRRLIGKSLRERHFTSAIVLPNSFKSALIPFHARIPRRIGWRGEWRNLLLSDCRKLEKSTFPLMVQRFAALAYPKSDEPPRKVLRPRLHTELASTAGALRKFDLSSADRVVAICPGAEFGAAKQWPTGHYAELSNALIADGWRVWLMGSANDTVTAKAIISEIHREKREHCRDLTGKTSLAEAIDLMSTADVVVSNDSGLMHIAAALDKAIVAIYGSTSPDFTPPLAERVILLTTDIECRPCFKRECPYGHLRCLTELDPSRAIAAVHELTSDSRN
jgi:heptosyltransferase-2